MVQVAFVFCLGARGVTRSSLGLDILCVAYNSSIDDCEFGIDLLIIAEFYNSSLAYSMRGRYCMRKT